MREIIQLFLAIALSFGMLLAQEFRGSISGTVRDTSRAIVPGVFVSAINKETNAASETWTNGEGVYQIPFLMPGNYKLLVEIPGFSKIERTGIRVSVGSQISLDFTLEVAVEAKTVTVVASTPLLNTSNAELGQVVERLFVEKIPVSLTRNAVNRVFLAPGVTGRTGTYTSNAQSDLSIAGGGSTRGRIEFMVDGIPNTVARSGGLIVFVPSVDSVEEMKIHTTLFDAAYGHSNGGAVNITTRGGTNELHGAIYDFKRWKALNANSWTNNRLRLPKPPEDYNQFGATVGGPVYLPGLYNGRNRTFFMFSLEHDDDKRPLTREARVPTELERNGDFSQTLNRRGAGLLEIYDPWTTTGSGSSASRARLQGAKIPASRLHPIGSAVAKAYPLPNLPGTPQIGRFNWAGSKIYEVVQKQFSVRIDHIISPRHRLFGRFSRLTRIQEADEFFPGIYSFPAGGTSDLGLLERFFYSVALDDTLTFNPTFIASFRYGFSGRDSPSASARQLADPAVLQLPSLILQNQATKGFPRFLLGENFAALGASRSKDNFYTHSVLATFSKLVGKHALKFGLDYRASRWNNLSLGSAQSGEFTFSPVFTQRNPFVPTSADTSGSGLASLLLGVPASGSLGFNSPLSLQNHYLALFVQEDWKVRPKFTFNIGLRYELETPYTERYNRVSYGFDYNAPSSLQVRGLNLRGGLLFAGKEGNPRREGNLDLNNFGPRVGFAYSLDDKTVVRAGYGLFYSAQSYNSGFDGSVGTFNAVTPYVGTIDNGATPFTTLANPFPGGIRNPQGNEKKLLARYGDSLTFFNQNRVNPYNQQWQLSIQREFPGQLLVEVGYNGMLSLKQLESFNLNEKPDRFNALGAEENRRVSNPFVGVFDSTSLLGQGSTLVQRQLWVLYPQYTSLRIEGANTGRAVYHAFLARLEKRFSHGLAFLWNYTNSKLIDNQTTSIINERHYRSVSEFDVPQVMRVAFVYELPFGPGRSFASSSGLVGHVLGGWSFSGYAALAAGTPLSITHANGRPVRLRNPSLQGSTSKRLGDQVDPISKKVLNPYFDVAAFNPLPSIYVVSPELPYLDELRSPRSRSLNLSIFKDVKLRETVGLQIRVEATGVTNTPNFAAPGTNMSQLATFGVIRSAGGSRNVQIGARLTF